MKLENLNRQLKVLYDWSLLKTTRVKRPTRFPIEKDLGQPLDFDYSTQPKRTGFPQHVYAQLLRL